MSAGSADDLEVGLRHRPPSSVSPFSFARAPRTAGDVRDHRGSATAPPLRVPESALPDAEIQQVVHERLQRLHALERPLNVRLRVGERLPT